MIDFIETEIGKIPSHWKVIPFDEALKVKGRVGWKGYKTSDLRNEGPVVVGGTNIKATLFLDFSETTYLAREKYEESPEIILKKGDVILVTRGNGIGDVGYYNGEFNEATINPSLVILSDFVGNSKYLFYYLNSTQGKQQVQSIEGGTSIPALYQGYIKTLLCPIPPIEEQNRIADVLTCIDEKMFSLNRQNQSLEKLAETLFRHWFVEEAKEEWEVKSLTEIATYLNGLALQKFPSNGIDFLPVIKIKELNQGITENSDRCNRDVPHQYIIQDGDILFSWSGSLEVVIWNDGVGALNQHLFKVSSENYPKWFYYLATKYHLPEFRMIAESKSTTMGHIQREHLKQALVSIPPSALLNQYGESISPLIEKIIKNNAQIKTLTKQRDTLLPKLMSGEVTVSN